MYHVEFQAMNAKLLMDPKRQIFLDQNMLTARVPEEGAYNQPFLNWGRPEIPPSKASFIWRRQP